MIHEFFCPRGQPLFKWAGIVQKAVIKTLFSENDFSGVKLNSLIQFCFPTENPISGPLSFVFRFRTDDESFYNAFCLLDQTSYQLKEFDSNQQCCIIIISQYYHFDVFDEALKIARSLLLNSIPATQHFFETLFSNPMIITSMNSVQYLWTTPLSSYFNQLINPLISKFDPITVGSIIFDILSDAPFLVVSSDLTELSQFCYALYSIVSPLKWYHIFAPILPVTIIETVQSPAPYIVGIHSSLLSKITYSDVEAHCFIDIDQMTVRRVNLQPIPSWINSSIKSITDFTQKSIHQLILRIVCSALNIHPSGSPYLNAKKIISSFQNSGLEPGSVQFQLVNSRTVRCLLDASKEKTIEQSFISLLSSFANTGVLFPATQCVDEFPLRKTQVLRSSSVQFEKKSATFKSISVPELSHLALSPQTSED